MKEGRDLKQKVSVILILSIIAILGLCPCAFARNTPSLNFRHYTIENGMSVNAVYCITQDSKGFMWFGTIDGLNRFDGRNIKLFKPLPSELDVCLGNIIYAVCEDQQRRLWVGSDGGLALFDLVAEQFEPFSKQTQMGTEITTNVTSIYADSDNNVWIGTNGQGLFVYDSTSERLEQFVHEESDSESICSNQILRICQDSRGNMWFTSLDNGVCVLTADGRRFRNYSLSSAGEKTRTEALFEDSQGGIWLGNNDNGLVNLDPKSGRIVCYLDRNSQKYVRHIRSIIEYMPGVLLLASDDGLIFFDLGTKQATAMVASYIDNEGLNDNYLHALYVDREKGLWIGTYFGGVNYISSINNVNFTNYSHSTVGNSIPGKIVSAFCEDPDGNLWIGTDDAGISFFDTRKRTFTNFKPEKGRNSLSYQNIHALMYADGKLWIGTYTGGLDILDVRTRQFRNYQPTSSENSLYSSSIYAIYRDRHDNIWLGTPRGLNRYNARNDDFERIEELRNRDVTAIIEDNRGNIWVGTFGDGIFALNVRSGVWTHFPVSQSTQADKVSAIGIDQSERLWIGTAGEGLFSFDYDKEIFVPYRNAEFPSGVIHKIIPDYGFLWISTNRGIVKLNPDKNILKLYNRYDGLPNDQFSPNAGIKASNGKLYFGGINGFTCFTPSELKENKLPPAVTFTNLRIWNREMSSRRRDESSGRYLSPLRKSISYTDELVLSHSQSTFSIEFVALSFTAPLKNKYIYRLEGFETEWSAVGDEPKLSYMNLPSGKYQLQVRASNGDDVWTPDFAKLDIVIRPPLWRSTVAYIFYLLLILSGITYLYYSLIRRTKRQHEIELQRLERSKEKDIYNAKVNFFTNIVHEIRTPLSLIMAPLDVIMKSRGRIDAVQEELTVISRNSNRLLKLVNQLMDFRKIEAEGLLLKFENLDLVALMKQICASFQSVKNQRITDVSFVFPDQPCAVYVDAEAVEKVVSNLFFNAVKFTKDTIVVEIVPCPSEGIVELRIKDNGCGISKENLDKIFQPFYQVGANQCLDTPGTGIGLTLAHSLTKAMGGKLVVRSQVGRGSEFIVQLPIVASDYIDIGTGVPSVSLGDELLLLDDPLIAVSDTKLTLMIIDDNEDLCRFLQKQLQDNYHILVCDNALEAIEMLKEHHVDLIVCDVMMPQMDGTEFTRIVKNRLETSHIPILLLTAKADIDAKIEGLDSGADVYIEKPFSVDFLNAQISSLITNRDRLRQQFVNMPFVGSQTIANGKSDLELLKKMDDIIGKNISKSEFSINELAGELCMSRATLFEKVKNVSGLTPNNYIQLKRLKQAAVYIHSGEYQISEVCYLVGFSSSSYFTKCFKRQFGVLPTDLGKQKV